MTLQPENSADARYAGFMVRSTAAFVDSVVIFLFIIFSLAIARYFIGDADVKSLGERFSLMVMHFLSEKAANIGNLQTDNPTMMEAVLLKVIQNIDHSLSMILLPVHLVFAFLYFAIPESSRMQGSFGKYVLDIKIVNNNGERIGLLQAMARNVLKIVPGYFYFIFSIIIPGAMLFDKRKRGLHDMACKTYVIYK